MVFFFKQKTAYEMCGRDWSSDVCSSDLVPSLIRENERRTEPLIATYTVKVENLAVKIL